MLGNFHGFDRTKNPVIVEVLLFEGGCFLLCPGMTSLKLPPHEIFHL